MSNPTLQEALATAESPVEYLRNLDVDSEAIWSQWPNEYSTWIEEQQAWRETCVLMDQSYHMINQFEEGLSGAGSTVGGEEAIELFSDLGVNSFEDFRSGDPPQAKQLVMCNHDGYVIADCILFYLEDERFLTVGTPVGPNWIRYNAETGDYDVSIDVAYHPLGEGSPRDFRFEIAGPNAVDVMDEVTDDHFDGVPFFDLQTLSINGHDVYALGHQMSGESGLEIFGSYDHHDEIKELILEAGEEYGLRQLGSKSYKSTPVESAWIPVPVPAIYDGDEMEDYRDWLDVTTFEANFAIGGSYESDEISDYYLTPHALGYGRHINFDHEFIGRDALEEMVDDPAQTRVTLVWESEDVVDIYGSLFDGGDSNQYLELPDTSMSYGDVTRYDTVLKDGDIVGVSKWASYNYNEREMLSLCCIDVEHSDPGTEVTLIWGEEGTAKSRVERHSETEIQATVAPAPYVKRGRRGN